MQADQIRETVAKAKQACAEAESAFQAKDVGTADQAARRLIQVARELSAAAEALLQQREEFSGRLSRSAFRRDTGVDDVKSAATPVLPDQPLPSLPKAD